MVTGVTTERDREEMDGDFCSDGWVKEDLGADFLVAGVGLLCQNPPGGPRTTTESPPLTAVNLASGM